MQLGLNCHLGKYKHSMKKSTLVLWRLTRVRKYLQTYGLINYKLYSQFYRPVNVAAVVYRESRYQSQQSRLALLKRKRVALGAEKSDGVYQCPLFSRDASGKL